MSCIVDEIEYLETHGIEGQVWRIVPVGPSRRGSEYDGIHKVILLVFVEIIWIEDGPDGLVPRNALPLVGLYKIVVHRHPEHDSLEESE